MRLIVALASEQNMTKAARAVHISQSTLSYHVGKIESDLGFELFDRSRHGTFLSPAGRTFAQGLERIVAEYDLLVESARKEHESTTHPIIVLAITPDSHSVMNALASQLVDELPDFEFRQVFCTGFDILDELRTGKVDIAYRANAGLEKACDLAFEPIARTEEVWLVPESHPLATRDHIGVEDIAGQKVWLVPKGALSPAADGIRQALAQKDFGTTIIDYTDEGAMLLSVLSGEALAVTRSGSTALIPSGVKCIPMATDDYANVEGLVYRAADKARLAPIIEVARRNAAV